MKYIIPFYISMQIHTLPWYPHVYYTKKVREKSRECHNYKSQPFRDHKRKRKPTNLNKHKPNKRTKSTKISSLFPKRANRNTKRTEKHKNKIIITNIIKQLTFLVSALGSPLCNILYKSSYSDSSATSFSSPRLPNTS